MRRRYAGRMKYCGIYRLVEASRSLNGLSRLMPDDVYRMYMKSNLELLRLLFYD